MADEPNIPKLTKEQQDLKDMMDAVLNSTEAQTFAVQNLIASYQQAGAAVENLKLQQAEAVDNVKETLTIQEEIVAAKLKELDAQIAVLRATDDSAKKHEDEIKKLGIASKKLRLRLRYYSQIEGETESIAKHAGLAFHWEKSSLRALWGSSQAIDGVAGGFTRILTQVEGMTTPMEAIYGFAKKTAEETVKFGKAFYKASISLNKATGMADEFANSMFAVAHNFSLYGLSMDEITKHQEGLIEGMADFTKEGKSTRDNLIIISAEMNALGVSNDDYVKSLNFMTKTMGFGADAAAEYTKDLVVYGAELGKTPKTFLKEFSTAVPKLVVYGQRMDNIFYRLQKRSKATGISFDDLLGVTEGFHEFDNVSKMVAGLNSQFGNIALDPMQLLFLDDPDEQLRVIREAILATGVQIDQLSSADQRLLAQNLKFKDASQMIAYMNGEWEEQNKKNAAWNKLLEKSSGIMDKVNTMFQALGNIVAEYVAPAFEWLDKKLAGLVKNKEESAKWAAVLMVLGKIATWGMAKFLLGLVGVNLKLGLVIKGFQLLGRGLLFIATKAIPFILGGIAKLTVGLWGMVVAGGPILWAIMAIGLAVAGIIIYWDELVAGFKAAGGWLKDKFGWMFGSDNEVTITQKNGKTTKAHNGITGASGGALLMKSDEIMTNVPSGTSVLTKGNAQTIETLLRDLTTAVNNLSRGGSNMTANLVVDGKKLASAVFDSSEYFAI